MSVELLQKLAIIAFIFACIFFVLAVILFFVLKVPKIFGDLSGSNAKKAIASIRDQNADSGNKAYKPSSVNMSRGKLTDKITPSGRLKRQSENLNISMQTQKMNTEKLAGNAEETTVLNQDDNCNTTVLTNTNGFSVDYEEEHTDSTEIIE